MFGIQAPTVNLFFQTSHLCHTESVNCVLMCHNKTLIFADISFASHGMRQLRRDVSRRRRGLRHRVR